ncbi:hypothetical protein L1887_15863 [Cichorium endivia]|nr:hypothetical protein L1887_15863 [Cichorium endivia]
MGLSLVLIATNDGDAEDENFTRFQFTLSISVCVPNSPPDWQINISLAISYTYRNKHGQSGRDCELYAFIVRSISLIFYVTSTFRSNSFRKETQSIVPNGINNNSTNKTNTTAKSSEKIPQYYLQNVDQSYENPRLSEK